MEDILPGGSPVIRAGDIGAIRLPPIDEVGSGSGPAQVGISIPRFVEIAPSGFLSYTAGPDRAGKSRRGREQNADTKSIEGMISHALFHTFFYSKNKFLMERAQKNFLFARQFYFRLILSCPLEFHQNEDSLHLLFPVSGKFPFPSLLRAAPFPGSIRSFNLDLPACSSYPAPA
ncbi:hypothetical protein [Akkermansia muciniphila]|uniref:hypothetical protein n=1 Tax=Akkermansia muciniphila TaxID=239935 RepID=UPI0011AFD270|nr:hypothetical protein [Akkermansia muciniphila]